MDNGDPGTGTGAQAIQQELQSQVELSDSIAEFYSADAEILDDLDLRVDDKSAFSKTDSAITPLRWGRHIFWSRIERSSTTQIIGDSAAIVTITRSVPAELRLGVQVPGGSPGGIDSVIKKPFKLVVKRSVKFIRIGRGSDVSANWRPAAISLVYGSSSPSAGNSFRISQMEISGRYNASISDPLDAWFRYGHGPLPLIPELLAGDTLRIRVTVESAGDSAEVVFLRHGYSKLLAERHRMQMNLVSQHRSAAGYVRAYERVLMNPPLPAHVRSARLSMTVDAFFHGSLRSGNAPVNNEFWGAPYIVRRF